MRTGPKRYWAVWATLATMTVSLGAGGRAGAVLLSELFPEGVPGFDAAPGVTVLSRSRPAFDPLGIRAGAFMLWPQLEEAAGYDDNVLAGTQHRGSWTVQTRPSLLINSDWSQGVFGAYVSASDTRYPELPDQGRTDATGSIGGTIDIGQDKLTLAAAHVQQHEDRSQLDAVPSDRPITVQIDDARASYALSSGRWTMTPSLEASRWQYGNTTIQGVPASQAYRDRDVVQGGTTVRYDWEPLRSLLFVVRATDQRYTNQPSGQASENSTGYQALAGFDYDDNAVWRYRVLLGGETRQFASYRPHTDFIAEMEATWSPSGMTTVHGTLSRSIEDAAQEGVTGFTYTVARLTIDHEYLRNVLLSASAGLQRADFLQGGGTQNGYSAGVGTTWLVNHQMRLSATYDLTGVAGSHTTTTLVSGDYARQVMLLTLRLGL
jgi:hypothetical protein